MYIKPKIVKEFRSIIDYIIDQKRGTVLEAVIESIKQFKNQWESTVLRTIDQLDFANLSHCDNSKIAKHLNLKRNQDKQANMHMTAKKKHEVDEMSFQVARLCRYIDVSTVRTSVTDMFKTVCQN